ncbi:cytoskeleton-associated protein 2 [Odontesthes bonariensis]|uniref:cytoskeleton-associated protein 2 n=1 Tax=Odontesthes bonariensis TaxID=219752 RepID=UPI003F58E866
MDNITVSRRNHTNRKGNKENAPPAHGAKSSIKGDKTSAVQIQLKGNKKEETVAKDEPLKAKPLSGGALKKVKPVQRDERGAAAARNMRQTHSQVFLTEQAVKQKKIIAEAPKQPAAVVPSKSALGLYKGKIVQSKIGSIWKSNDNVGAADPKPTAPKTERQRVGNMATKNFSKSVAVMPRRGTQKPAQARSKSVSDVPDQLSKPAASSRRPAGFYSARPPTRTVSATLTTASSRNTTVAPIKASGNQNSKPKVVVADKKVNKPTVSSTLSQYRFTVVTAEERRAKLADWLASKGKTLKRPAMATAAPLKNEVSAKAEDNLKPQSHAEHKLVTQFKPDPSLEAPKLDSAVPAHYADTQGAEVTKHSQTPEIMDTTLDLLENSDSGVDDIVLNLCDALEAMMTPSTSSDNELVRATDESDVETDCGEPVDECKTDELKNEVLEDICQQPKVEQVKDEEESNDQKVEDVESDEDVMETTPQLNDASVIKYSVKTTPYLQSVRKTIEGETGASSAKRKSSIKDLKFLTPVRRSCRIQRKSSCLPTMLVDHDPCVSSLAELVRLDDDPNAYIYRRNPALLEELPDQNRL